MLSPVHQSNIGQQKQNAANYDAFLRGFVVLANNTSSHKWQNNPSGKFDFVIEASDSCVHNKMYFEGLGYTGLM